MKKGFTLIELLAVIVILAIIALIATPIVLSIINDTKESAVIRSGEFYVDAVKNKIMQENMKLGGTLNPEECIVNPEGNVTCDGTALEIEVDGQKPTSGSITFDKGKVTNINLTFGDKTVTMNPNGELVLGDNAKVCNLISGNANEIGSKYECEVKPGTKFNFFVLSKETNDTTNLIMERNICDDGTVATAENKCEVAWMDYFDYGCSGDDEDCPYTDKGPITAMTYLNNATSSWSNIQNLNITYDDEGRKYTDFAVTGKARLPYYNELIGDGKCLSYAEIEVAALGSCPIWLSNYLSFSSYVDGEGVENISGINAYWAFSSNPYDINYAWCVYSNGYVYDKQIHNDMGIGVRPVINVKL